MWKDLSMSEKSDIIRLSIRNGISDLDTIKKLYDENSSEEDSLPINDVVGQEENEIGGD